MSELEITEAEKLISLLDKNHRFHKVDDATRFMIHGMGTVDAKDLRIIAVELDRRNNVQANPLDCNFYIEDAAQVDPCFYQHTDKVEVTGSVIDICMANPRYIHCMATPDVVVTIDVGEEFDKHTDALMDLIDKSVTIVAEVGSDRRLKMKSLNHQGTQIP